MRCKHCKQETELRGGAHGNHVRWCDSNPDKEASLHRAQERLAAARAKRNLLPGSNQHTKAAKEGRRIEATEETREKLRISATGRLHTSETKELLSKKRRKWLEENPERHPWKRSDKFTSIPCEILKQKLRDSGISFEEEYQPIQGRFFSIDIAIPEKKIGIEVNGEQHYKRSGELKDYYRDRHKIIEEAGWTLIELHYALCYNEDVFGAMVKRIS